MQLTLQDEPWHESKISMRIGWIHRLPICSCCQYFDRKDCKTPPKFRVYVWEVLGMSKLNSSCMVDICKGLQRIPYTTHPSLAQPWRRSSLMVALTACLGGLWTVEQPGGSLLEFYPSWREIMSRLFEHGGANCVTPLFWLKRIYVGNGFDLQLCFYVTMGFQKCFQTDFEM